MSSDKFADIMTHISHKYGDNPERMHYEMDYVIMNLLESLGYEKGVLVFEAANKWHLEAGNI